MPMGTSEPVAGVRRVDPATLPLADESRRRANYSGVKYLTPWSMHGQPIGRTLRCFCEPCTAAHRNSTHHEITERKAA